MRFPILFRPGALFFGIAVSAGPAGYSFARGDAGSWRGREARATEMGR